MTTALQEFTADYLVAIEEGNAPDYGIPIAVVATVNDYGTGIYVEFSDGKRLSPYFNQYDSEGDCWGNVGSECRDPDECEFGWCGSDRFDAEQDPDEWLVVMSGATDWSEGKWEPLPAKVQI
jgi:hypothetical protein